MDESYRALLRDAGFLPRLDAGVRTEDEGGDNKGDGYGDGVEYIIVKDSQTIGTGDGGGDEGASALARAGLGGEGVESRVERLGGGDGGEGEGEAMDESYRALLRDAGFLLPSSVCTTPIQDSQTIGTGDGGGDDGASALARAGLGEGVESRVERLGGGDGGGDEGGDDEGDEDAVEYILVEDSQTVGASGGGGDEGASASARAGLGEEEVESRFEQLGGGGGGEACSPSGRFGADPEGSQWNRGEIDGLFCPICMEAWTDDGDHHMCCLPCGHIYGMSCIKRWLKQRGNSGKCPQCNNKCKLKDVRKLFATRLVTVDEESQKKIRFLEAKCASLEKKVAGWHMKEVEWRRQEKEWHVRINEFEKRESELKERLDRLQERTNDLERFYEVSKSSQFGSTKANAVQQRQYTSGINENASHLRSFLAPGKVL
ncbi:uncharacterized protein LOC104439370 [Eucalyptus grandis]|uniref:uncharacterized protein LOC104439370 n=1 Tax=Eucalyptus grandis TaxID=71139 RepID=UPI00192EDCC0|nr:uncharacterized protein LOC104439370 [Eucalyptus grandis]